MSVQRMKNGRGWYTSFRFKDPKTGKPRQKKKEGFPTKREALQYQRKFLDRIAAGDAGELFADLWSEYIADAARYCKRSTIIVRQTVYTHHIPDEWKNRPASAITPDDIRRWRNWMVDAGLKPITIRSYNTIVSAAFLWMERYHDSIKSPFAAAGPLRLPPAKGKKLDYWTLEEYRAFIGRVEEPVLRMACEMLFYTGLRRGELLALRWMDINLDAGILHVRRNRVAVDHKIYITTPKTPSSIRDVPIPKRLIAELRDWKAKQYKPNAKSLIISFAPYVLTTRFRREQQRQGVKHTIKLHSLRHSHASLLIQLGFSIQAIADRLGHTTPTQVLQTYGHLYPSRRQEIADKLDDI